MPHVLIKYAHVLICISVGEGPSTLVHFILHDMHMGLESLESALKSASFDIKIISIACWEHVEPENTIHCNGIV